MIALLVGIASGIAGMVLVGELAFRIYLPQAQYAVSGLHARPPALLPCTANEHLARGGLCTDPKTDTGVPFEDIELRADGEPTLRGWWIPAASDEGRAVLFIHGASSDRREGLRFVQTIHAAGYGMLLADLRNHGTSDNDGLGVRYGVEERFDVLRAAKWLRSDKRIGKVVVFGISMGGASAILAAARDDGKLIDGVIAEAPYASIAEVLASEAERRHVPRMLGLRVTDALHGTMGHGTFALTPAGAVAAVAPRPLLLFADRKDTLIPSWHTDFIFAEAREPKRLVEFPEAGHALGFNSDPARYARELTDFLRQN